METEVDYENLYKMSEYFEDKNSEFIADYQFISSLSNSLSTILQGQAEEAIVSRIKNFNETNIKKLASYSKILGNEINLGAKLYNAEDEEFEQRMKREASKYE